MSLSDTRPAGWADARQATTQLTAWLLQATYLLQVIETRHAERNRLGVDRALGAMRQDGKSIATADALQSRVDTQLQVEEALLLRLTETTSLEDARWIVAEVEQSLAVLEEQYTTWHALTVRCDALSDEDLAGQDLVKPETLRDYPRQHWSGYVLTLAHIIERFAKLKGADAARAK